jgi:hypothetical protein
MALIRLNSVNRFRASSLSILTLAVLLTGCVSYTNVPVPESAPAFKSANHGQSIMVVTRALETVITQHPVSGPYVINLPAGTTPESFEKIIADIPDGAIMPYEGMSEDLPVYHIGRIWIRASDAKVDVIYPFTRADGIAQDQNVTIWLSGGVRTWRAYREQYWSAGTIPTPPIYVPILDQSGDADDVGEIEEEVIETSDSSAMIETDSMDEESVEPTTDPIQQSDQQGVGYHEVPVKSQSDD